MISEADDISEGGDALPPALAERLLFLVKRAQRTLVAVTEPALARFGLDNRAYTLLVLIEAEGSGSQQRLGARLGVDRTTMVAVVDAAEQAGLVARRRNPDDRRAYVVEMTAAGARALREARPVVEAVEREATAALAPRELDGLKRALRALGPR